MGPCCGPCHDRREEAILPAESHPPTIHDLFPGPIHALAYSPDGAALAVSRSGRRLSYHDLTTGLSRKLFVGDGRFGERDMRSLAFSPGGETLAVADPEAGGVRWFEVHTGEGHRLASSWHEGNVERVAFSPDGRTLAGLSDGEGVDVWSAGSWTRRWALAGATAMAYAPDGQTLAVEQAGAVRLFETNNWVERGRFATTMSGPNKAHLLDYTPDGQHLVLLTGRGGFDLILEPELRLEVWDVARRQERLELRANVTHPSTAALSPDGRYLAWVVHDQRHSPGSITFWDLFTAREEAQLEWDGQDMIYDLTFSPDGETLATGSQSGTVKLWPWRRLLEG
jgi:WD40 repeat protein